jgi:hypothetical protein
MQRLAQVTESRSSFIEIKSLAALTVPLAATGKLLYRRPAYFEKTTLQPRPENLVVDGDRLTLTEAGETPQVVDLDGQPSIRALVDAIRGTLAGDLPLLRHSYQVSMEGEPAAWHLTLTPIDAGTARLVTRIIIEGTGTTLRFVRTIQPNGDESRMTVNPLP